MASLAAYFEASNIAVFPEWCREQPLGVQPRSYQFGDLNHLAQDARSGLYNDPGLGKTLPVQAYLIWAATCGNKAIASVPPTLVPQFLGDFEGLFPGIGKRLKIEAFRGDVKQRDALIARWDAEGWPDILVMSYQMFVGKTRKAVEALQGKRAKKGITGFSPADGMDWQAWKDKGYNLLAVDEAHCMKSPSSAMYKAVKGFAGPVDSGNGLVLITGSPIETKLTDAYIPISLLTPWRYSSYRSFEYYHCVKADDQVVGYQNEELIYAGLYQRGRRVLKKDVLDLPPKQVAEVRIELGKEHMALYRKLCQERVLEIGDRVIDATQAGALYMKSQQILLCPELFAEDWNKPNAMVEWLDQLVASLGGRKLLVFAWFRDCVEKLRDHFPGSACIYGGVTGGAREKEKQKFVHDKDCKVAVVQQRAGGVGIDGWQGVCSHVAFMEIVPSPGSFTQAYGRLDRSGQKEMVNIYLPVVKGTISVKLRNGLVRRELEANSVMRDARTVLADLMGEEGIKGEIE